MITTGSSMLLYLLDLCNRYYFSLQLVLNAAARFIICSRTRDITRGFRPRCTGFLFVFALIFFYTYSISLGAILDQLIAAVWSFPEPDPANSRPSCFCSTASTNSGITYTLRSDKLHPSLLLNPFLKHVFSVWCKED